MGIKHQINTTVITNIHNRSSESDEQDEDMKTWKVTCETLLLG